MTKLDDKVFEPLDEYEEELIKHIESDDFQSVELLEERKKELQQIAKNTIKALDKKKRISINLKSQDLEIIKQKANSISIPYQNIIQALVHNYAVGKIKLEV